MFSPDTAQAVGVLLQDLVAMMPRRWASIRVDVERDVDDDFVRLVNVAPASRARAGHRQTLLPLLWKHVRTTGVHGIVPTQLYKLQSSDRVWRVLSRAPIMKKSS
jgi:hypothetical protein